MKQIFTHFNWRFRLWWSNIYWKHIRKAWTTYPVSDADKRQSFETIPGYVKRCADVLFSSFSYKHDGAAELWDSQPPPAEVYSWYDNRFQNKGKWSDDCDGFHACLYHLCVMSNISCFLLSLFSGGKGHCVLAYYDENSICHIIDYTSDYYDIDFESIIKARYVNGEDVYVYAKLYNYDRARYKAFPLDKHKYDCYEV